MAVGPQARGISTKELETWLSKIFIPIEPNEVFVRKLRARLIKYHGKQPFSGWMVAGAVAMALMLLLTWFGLALRIILLVLGLLGFLNRGKRSRARRVVTATGAIEI